MHLGEWLRDYYNNDIFDVTHWQLTIEFADGHKVFENCGSNEYQYNFYKLQVLLGINDDNIVNREVRDIDYKIHIPEIE